MAASASAAAAPAATLTRCTICGSERLEPVVDLPRGVRVLECSGCTNALTSPAPSASYDDHQFFAHAGASEAQWRGYSRQIAAFLARNGRTRGRLLDVGCSHGLLVEEAARIGLDAEGIEPSATAVEHCRRRGLRVRHGYLAEGSYPPGTFDVIVMSHVAEHIERPAEFLRAAAGMLAEGGVVCLCQTNFRGTVPRMLGRRWDYWVEHEHYFHFSPDGIGVLLAQAGLAVRTVELLPLGYRWRTPVPNARALRHAAVNLLSYTVSRLRLGLPFAGDQMYVLAARAP
jgi:SAM-dependent methyltransferase